MKNKKNRKHQNFNPVQDLFEVLRDDLSRTDLVQSVKREIEELKEFMLDEGRKRELESMNTARQLLVVPWWLLKGMFYKLVPVRRLLVVAGVALFLWTPQQNSGEHQMQIAGAVLILLVLMLELKDKLLAHEELAAGRVVQQALMPERTPAVPGWDLWIFTRSANEVGGDLVDFIRLGENRFGAVLGDVAGKGLSAALLMAKLQATIQALAPDTPSLSRLGQNLNRIFCRDCLPKSFASIAYLDFQSGSGTVRVLNAGHIPPIVYKRGRVSEMAKGGAALGMAHHAVYHEQRVSLGPGDFVFVYSDGVVEARNGQGDFFGDHRLFDLVRGMPQPISPEKAGEKILASVNRFIGSAKAYDDLSVVILKRKE
jgi:sigma-B regulation protein RsbU (phosphoserine phosphatase)